MRAAAMHIILAAALAASAVRADTTLRVYADGTGDYASVQAALDWAVGQPPASLGHLFLRLRGWFWERVVINATMTGGVTLLGPGAGVPFNLDAAVAFNVSGANGPAACRGGGGPGTFGSYTMRVDAPNVTLLNVAVINSACGYNHEAAGQSVALHVNAGADRLTVLNSSLLGSQDTLFTGDVGMRSYFGGVFINGSCDALFGSSSTVFEGCSLEHNFTVTAHRGGAVPWSTPAGPVAAYLFLGGSVTTPGTVLLGRPWGPNSTVVFKGTAMGAGVEPPGWNDWSHGCTAGGHPPSWCDSTFYAEWRSSGPGARPDSRVWWSRQLSDEQAAGWTADAVLNGWQPLAGLPELLARAGPA